MTHNLERERVRDPGQLEAERRRPGGISRVSGLHPAYTPVAEDQAAHNRAVLATALDPASPEELEGTA